MTTFLSLLVGSHYVPPAKILLEHLPAGYPLSLIPDPGNPYDENAIKVMANGKEIPLSQHQELEVKLPGAGMSLEEVLEAKELFQLGHVAASGGKPLLTAGKTQPGLVGNLEFLQAMREGECQAFLAFGADGKPWVRLVSGEV